MPDLGRVFLMLNYTDITQNTYVQSRTVTEIIAREKCVAHWTSMMSRTAYSTSTPMKPTLSSGYYLRNRSTLDIGVLGYIGIV